MRGAFVTCIVCGCETVLLIKVELFIWFSFPAKNDGDFCWIMEIYFARSSNNTQNTLIWCNLAFFSFSKPDVFKNCFRIWWHKEVYRWLKLTWMASHNDCCRVDLHFFFSSKPHAFKNYLRMWWHKVVYRYLTWLVAKPDLYDVM